MNHHKFLPAYWRMRLYVMQKLTTVILGLTEGCIRICARGLSCLVTLSTTLTHNYLAALAKHEASSKSSADLSEAWMWNGHGTSIELQCLPDEKPHEWPWPYKGTEWRKEVV